LYYEIALGDNRLTQTFRRLVSISSGCGSPSYARQDYATTLKKVMRTDQTDLRARRSVSILIHLSFVEIQPSFRVSAYLRYCSFDIGPEYVMRSSVSPVDRSPEAHERRVSCSRLDGYARIFNHGLSMIQSNSLKAIAASMCVVWFVLR